LVWSSIRPGLKFSSSGVLSGTPTKGDVYYFNVDVQDKAGQFDEIEVHGFDVLVTDSAGNTGDGFVSLYVE
jgi:hypothetical protein